jgi:secreted trypsin-like serine protease
MKLTVQNVLVALLCTFLFTGCGGSSGDGGGELSTNSCSILGLNTRIINGAECSASNSPVVKLEILAADGSVALCSGTMLTSNDVLTAAHCFFEPVEQVAVEVAGQRVFADQVTVHSGVSASEEVLAVFNDVAIVRLSQPVASATLPIVLSRNVAVDDVFSIFGYGLDENGNAGLLRSGEMRASTVSDNHIIAGFTGNGSNSCNGDSGGPAIFTFNDEAGNQVDGVVGIVSSGNNVTCMADDTSLFTNTQSDSVAGFILSVVPDAGVI